MGLQLPTQVLLLVHAPPITTTPKTIHHKQVLANLRLNLGIVGAINIRRMGVTAIGNLELKSRSNRKYAQIGTQLEFKLMNQVVTKFIVSNNVI